MKHDTFAQKEMCPSKRELLPEPTSLNSKSMPRPAQKILAIKLRKLSEMLVWTGALQSLRRAYPEAQIDLLVPEELGHVFKGFPSITTVHIVPQGRQFALQKTLSRLRKQQYDLVLAFDSTPQLSRWAWLARGRETVIHEHSRKKKPFWSHLPVDNPGELADNLHLDSKVLLALGILDRIAEPTVFVKDLVKRQAFERMNFKFDHTEGKTKVALLPGAALETKRYPRDLWLESLDLLLAQKDLVLAVFADKSLSELWDLRGECFRRGVRLYDDLGIHELAAYLSWFQTAICNDSAGLHLATAVGVRTVTIFGPGNMGREHGYSRESHAILRASVNCRPEGPRDNERFQFCTLTQCSHLSCLRKIEPQNIVRHLRELLERIPSHGSRRKRT